MILKQLKQKVFFKGVGLGVVEQTQLISQYVQTEWFTAATLAMTYLRTLDYGCSHSRNHTLCMHVFKYLTFV